MSQSLEVRANRKAREVARFYTHAAWYVGVMAALTTYNLAAGHEELWFIWPLIGWGLGVASHGLAAFEVFRHHPQAAGDRAGED